MCDPVTIAGIALSAGGVAANTIAQGQIRDKREDAMAAERIRQAGFREQQAALNTQSQNRYGDFEGQQAEKSKQLGDYFGEQGTSTPTTEEAPASDSNIVNAEISKQRGKASAYGKQQNEALGSLRSFGDIMGENSRLQARDAGQIGLIGGLAKGSAGVLPLELDAANSAGNDMKMFGDILGGLGGIGLNAGLGGGTLVDPSAKAKGPLNLQSLAKPAQTPSLPFFARSNRFSLYPS